MYRPPNSKPQGTSLLQMFLIGCGTVVLGGFVLLVGLFVWLASGPEGGVRMSNDMEDYAVEYLRDHAVLEPTEEILAFYDVTITLDATEAAILTNERIVYYRNDDMHSVALDDIEEIRHRYESLIGDILEVQASSGKVLKIEIAPLNQGETFKNALFAAWEKAQEAHATDS